MKKGLNYSIITTTPRSIHTGNKAIAFMQSLYLCGTILNAPVNVEHQP
ncbi:hypothetical protein [Endozoicomonas sp. SESOKO3]|nr:hypothetical protein [Endozoicomonas sp. SESOKO3]